LFFNLNCDNLLPTGNPADVSVTGVTLDSTSLHFVLGGDPATLTAAITPTNATDYSVSWSSGNSGVAKVSNNGVVTPVASGSAIITVTTVDGGWTATCEVTVASANPIIGIWTVTKVEEKGNLTTKYTRNGVDSIAHVANDTSLEFQTNSQVCNYTTNGYRYDTYIFNIRDTLQYVYHTSDSSVVTTSKDGTIETSKFSLSGTTGVLRNTQFSDTLSSSTNPFTGTINYVILTGERIVTMIRN
jgi:hypothetical protein